MEELIARALEARLKSYSPYSGFAVGAALRTKSGKIYTGTNVENAAFAPTNCAERTAFFKAVSEGETEFSEIAIVGGKAGADPSEYVTPCGVCRQVMREFCSGDFKIYCAISADDYRKFTLDELLPEGFGPSNLK